MAPHVLHIPHASRFIPASCRNKLLLSDRDLETELIAMTDSWTDLLFPQTTLEAGRVVYPVSRLLRDVERFVDDAMEPMNA